MKKIYLCLIAASFYSAFAHAQILYNNGGTIFINTNGKVHVRGSLTNGTGATLTNNGILEVTGNSTNNGMLTAPVGSAIIYEGTAPLVISGSQTVTAQNVTINNAAGVTLNTPLQVAGTLTFVNGMINATNQPVIFKSTASVTGVTDASHVNGTVIKEGLGAFTYPVGDGSKYKQVAFNATANASGISVRYNGSAAGAGNYTAAGSDAMLLETHNTNEHWNIQPISTATGAITLFWDSQTSGYTVPLSARRVAHLKNDEWVNEGGIVTGTLTAGSVTSNIISTFSPFTFGSVPTVLPVKFGAFSVKADGNRAKLAWNTMSEVNTSHFLVKRSVGDGNLTDVANLKGKGNTNRSTHYTTYDYQPAKGKNYYFLIQVDLNGTATALDVQSLDFSLSGETLSAHPNPIKTTFNVVSTLPGAASIVAITGQVVKRLELIAGTNTVDASNWPTGIYILRTANGSLKLIKE